MSKQFTCHFEVGLDKSVQKVTVSTDSYCFVCKDIVTKTTSKDFLLAALYKIDFYLLLSFSNVPKGTSVYTNTNNS